MPVYTFKLAAFWQFWLLNLQGLAILVHMSFLQLNHICELTVAMVDKTSSGFNLCHYKKYSLPSTLTLYKLWENLLGC